MLKILVYIYNKSVQYHGHKYIKLGEQNKKNEKRGTRRGKEWEPEMGHGWVIGEWKVEMETQGWAQKKGDRKQQRRAGTRKVFSKVPHPKQGLQRRF
jgi:hypothetical protein